MKKGETAFVVFASLWLSIFVIASIAAQNYTPLGRILTVIIGFIPLTAYTIVQIVKSHKYKKAMKSFNERNAIIQQSRTQAQQQITVQAKIQTQKLSMPAPHSNLYTNRQSNKVMINSSLRILNDSYQIMQSTNNLETFFTRFELVKRTVSNLGNKNYQSN